MKKKLSLFSTVCVVFFFVFAAFMAWYVPSMSSVAAQTAEAERDLETNRGREGKQTDEYNKAVTDLPLVLAELQEKQPLAEESARTVEELKARRKELRAEKKALEAALNPEGTENSPGEEEDADGE